MKDLIYFSEQMKSIKEGVLHFYIHNCKNGFKQAILEHRINGSIVAAWMACDTEESNYLIENFK